MKGRNTVILIIALLGPVAIFLFLKLFARNQFDVPVLYDAGEVVDRVAPDCTYDYAVPYRVADSVMRGLAPNNRDSLFVFHLDDRDAAGINRVRAQFPEAPVQFISGTQVAARYDKSWLARCVLLLRGDTAIVLVDHRNRIRGNYGADRDEIDRLAVEMKILLKQY